MLAIEVFRPDEMSLIQNQKKNKNILKQFGKKKRSQGSNSVHDSNEIKSDNPYFKLDDIDMEAVQDRRTTKKKIFKVGKTDTVEMKMEKQADDNLSKMIIIKDHNRRESFIKKVQDDSNLNYLKGAKEEIDTYLIDDKRNQTFTDDLADTKGSGSLDEGKLKNAFDLSQQIIPHPKVSIQKVQKDYDEFGIDMSQFLDHTRSRSDGNFLDISSKVGKNRMLDGLISPKVGGSKK